MRADFRVTGATHDELKAAADRSAAVFAGDAAHTVTIGEVYAEHRHDPVDYREIGANEQNPARFFATVTVEVKDGVDNRPRRDDPRALRG